MKNTTTPSGLPKCQFVSFDKPVLRRRQYLKNLLSTNRTILKNHHINTLLLF